MANVQAQEATPAACCQNCGSPLAGRFCHDCGQRHDPHPHSLRHFSLELFEGLSHADSRFWRTIWTLLAKPGQLTLDFFTGRRERYLPPIRLYLIISLVLFALVPLLPSGDVAQFNADVATAVHNADPQTDECVNFDLKDGDAAPAPWLTTFAERLKPACNDIVNNGGRRIGTALQHNLPRMLFLLLPLIALCMSLLYWHPRRYYVEHVLLLVHNHAFVFSALILNALLGLLPYLGGLASGGFLIYGLWYLYASMRRYYGQSRRRTMAKMAAILLSYGLLAIVLLTGTLLITAITL